MTVSMPELRQSVANSGTPRGFPVVYGLNHYAFRCRDAEETRHFYEDILKLPLACTIYHDRVPSTGEAARVKTVVA
jgi:hypothetical protein